MFAKKGVKMTKAREYFTRKLFLARQAWAW
jgi:hypothetical protein